MTRLAGVVAIALLAAACAGTGGTTGKDLVIRKALDSTVQLFTDRGNGVVRTGSGVIYHLDSATGRGLVLTTAHLLEPPGEQTVTALAPPREEHLNARIVDIDAESDLALIEVDDLSGDAIDISPAAKLGDRIWVVAFPWGRERTVVSGVVSQVHAIEPPSDGRAPLAGAVRLIDASVSYGMSGGGIFSQDNGALVGLVRGYRSAELSFPGAASGTLTLPVAGETTVISVLRIQCFLKRQPAPDCERTARP